LKYAIACGIFSSICGGAVFLETAVGRTVFGATKSMRIVLSEVDGEALAHLTVTK
jgi:hypothetical protein